MIDYVAAGAQSLALNGTAEQYKSYFEHKWYVAKTVGRAAHRLVRNLSWKQHGRQAALTAINTVHYYTDEAAGFLGYQYLKGALEHKFSYAASSGVALMAESVAVGGVAYALGRWNLAAREKRQPGSTGMPSNKSIAEKTAVTMALGVPFNTQLGGLNNKNEIMEHTLHPFMTSNAVFVALVGAGVDLAGFDTATALFAAGYVGKNIIEGLYENEARHILGDSVSKG